MQPVEPPVPLDAHVVVVGFGPTGAMTALRCAQRGLSVVAIDASTELYPLPRAIALDAEAQRLCHAAGLGPRLERITTPMRGAEFLNQHGERVVGYDLPEGFRTAIGFPPMVSFEQPEFEGLLRDAAIDAGVDVRLGVEATGLDVSIAGHVVVATTNGPVVARWLVGADGASSWTRNAVDIGLEDQGFDQPWLVVDTTLLDPDLALSPNAQQYCHPDRVVTFVPGHRTRRRWEFQLRSDETRDEMLQTDAIMELLTPWAGIDQVRVDRAAVYRFHGLVADRFRDGPIFLAGDAAHQMPPFNGQGMNSGLRDAENLAWKLSLVHRGIMNDHLLDTYEAERRPHAVATVEHTCDAGRLIDDIAAGVDVSPEAGYGGGRPTPRLEAGLILPDHREAGKQLALPAAIGSTADRFDTVLGEGFALLVPAGAEVPSIWDLLEPAVIELDDGAYPGKYCSPDESIIVRPDRYVAAITDDLEVTSTRLLEAYLA